MAGPWEKYQAAPAALPAQPVAAQPWAKYQPPAAEEPKPVRSGSILPFSKYDDGSVGFDSNAGLLGAALRAFSLPGDVYEGKIDPQSEEGMSRTLELATFASPVNPAIRLGERAIPGVAQALVREAPPVPTAEALKAAASKGYDSVRDMGVDYNSASVGNLAATIRTGLESDGILAELAPKSFKVLSRLESPPEDSVAGIAGIEAARRAFGQAAKDFTNPTEQEAARRIVDGLDGFIQKADPASVVAGPAVEAGRLLKDSRGNYAASKRSGKLTGIQEAAELRAAVANSGQNLDNSTRQRLASLLLNPKAARGFSGDERAAIEQTARGATSTNAIRSVGNMLGGGGGLGAMVAGSIGSGIGAAIGGTPGAIVGGTALPAMGAIAKKIAANLTQKSLRGVDEMVRMRSPLYEEALQAAPLLPADPAKRTAFLRALLLSQQAGQ